MKPAVRYSIMVGYLRLKFEERDWHGVCDAANDIRELIARHPEIERKARAGQER